MSRHLAALTVTLLLAGCVPAGLPPSPSPSLAPSPSPALSPSPSPGPEGLYLRAWTSQALPPEHTITWLPQLTISEGVAIDGNVAIPMIYPGPILIMPNARPITPAGQAAIVELAGQLGLLEGDSDFSGEEAMPGAITAHVLMVVDGRQVELLGDPNALGVCAPDDLGCQAEPGTAEAFALYWARLGGLDGWLADELGPSATYSPERMAVVAVPPQPLEVPAQPVAWPLETSFNEFGEPWVVDGTRCATVEGNDLDVLLPALGEANQASVFVDSTDEARALLLRVLVPGEPSPCGA